MMAQVFGCRPPHFLHHAGLSLLDNKFWGPTRPAICPLVSEYTLLSQVFIFKRCLSVQDLQGANSCQRE